MTIRLSVLPGSLAALWERALDDAAHRKIAERIWNKDHTVWKPAPDEISNRLGWLQSHEDFKDEWPLVESFVTGVREDGFQQAILLGMGGSSLAPEIFRKILGQGKGYLDLIVCDTTAPDTISSLSAAADSKKTLFIVSTKSGGTVETLSAMKYFFRQTCNVVGEGNAGRHFLAITDPGSSLETEAKKHGFRHIFYGDPDIGGRYSGLSVFGLVPAALTGADVKKLLRKVADDHAEIMAIGVKLGCMMGAGANARRNKLTFFLSDSLASFGDWVEQLIAESTGKEGKGILPVVGEHPGQADSYGADRLFVDIRLQSDAARDLTPLEKEHPVAKIALEQIYDLGSLLYTWEVATAIAGHFLGVNPFDQPDVEASKQFTRRVLEKIQDKKAEGEQTPLAHNQSMAVYGQGEKAATPEDAFAGFLSGINEGNYVALQAFLAKDHALSELLEKLRLAIRNRYRVAATVGYGPRFLHSTGQLHKGDDGTGMFIQFTADNTNDVFIPDDMTGGTAARLSFGALQKAQALGDAKALEACHRRLLRIHFFADAHGNIDRLINSLQG